MTYADFKAKYNGYGVDFDGYYGDQCADLILAYDAELNGGNHRFWGNAADFITQDGPLWQRVYTPQQGDVVVYPRSAANGYAGHIAIVDDGQTVLSQNYPTGSPTRIIKITDPVLGYLRPTNLGGSMAQSLEDQVRDLYARLGQTQAQVEQERAKVSDLTNQVIDLNKQKGELQAEIERLRASTSGTINKDQVLAYLSSNLK